jgi:hypothetical protein
MSQSLEENWVLDEAEALLDMDGPRERQNALDILASRDAVAPRGESSGTWNSVDPYAGAPGKRVRPQSDGEGVFGVLPVHGGMPAAAAPASQPRRGVPARKFRSEVPAELEIIECDRLACIRSPQALHGVLVSARDPVQYRGGAASVGVGLLDRLREQSPREGGVRDASKPGKPCQPCGMLRVERDAKPTGRSIHARRHTTWIASRWPRDGET